MSTEEAEAQQTLVSTEEGKPEMAKEEEEQPPVRKIKLLSSDGEIFEVEESVATQSQTIKHMIEDVGADSEIPLPNVTGFILAKVIEYCEVHAEKKKHTEEKVKSFDAGFVKVEQDLLFDVIMAANYLDVKGLLDLTSQAVADMIKDMSVEEVRKLFNIENDFSAEEEAEIRKEHAWAFE